MTDDVHSPTDDSWVETIPKISTGNTFESDEHFFVTLDPKTKDGLAVKVVIK